MCFLARGFNVAQPQALAASLLASVLLLAVFYIPGWGYHTAKHPGLESVMGSVLVHGLHLLRQGEMACPPPAWRGR